MGRGCKCGAARIVVVGPVRRAVAATREMMGAGKAEDAVIDMVRNSGCARLSRTILRGEAKLEARRGVIVGGVGVLGADQPKQHRLDGEGIGHGERDPTAKHAAGAARPLARAPAHGWNITWASRSAKVAKAHYARPATLAVPI